MSKTILIDALYDEVRVALCEKGELIKFRYQNENRKQIKGNIYLAKVERIEPALQAAFVNYGNVNGFLPFSEIHPINYQISDKEKKDLLRMVEKLKKDHVNNQEIDGYKLDHLIYSEIYKKYKIQEVLNKNQLLKVQVTKEARGNKGVTLTNFTSLSGKYCVFLPLSNKKSGIGSNKCDASEIKRLNNIAKELLGDSVFPSLIIRNNAIHKTKEEIKQDFDYLMEVWHSISDLAEKNTLAKKYPCCLHDEGNIFKKIMKDIYNRDVEEVIISGEEAYEEIIELTKKFFPQHIGKIKKHNEVLPIFTKYQIEEQVNQLYVNKIPLKSGGYIIIEQTEALASIDINSGKSTKEDNIEDTALRTNLEAAEEIIKQMRLRSISGLIVVDFIDMRDATNKLRLENTMKSLATNDPAHIQIGEISEFGLMEMTRQRGNNSINDGHFNHCHTCMGRGFLRSVHTTANTILRAIQQEISAISDLKIISIFANEDVISFLLNKKRKSLYLLEERYNISIELQVDHSTGYEGFYLETNNNQYGEDEQDKKSLDDYFIDKKQLNHFSKSEKKEIKSEKINSITNNDNIIITKSKSIFTKIKSIWHKILN